MAASSFVVVLLLGTELGSPGAAELRESAQQALGPDTEVRVESVTGRPAKPAPSDAAGVVRLSFGPDARHVHLGCYLPRLRRWVERDLWFDPNDPETERGRTLGFLVASILVDQGLLSRPAAVPAHEGPQRSIGGTRSAATTALVAAGVEAAGPGTGSGFGAYAALEHGFQSWLWFGAAAQARFGSVPEAQASTRVLALGPELTLRPFPLGRGWLGVRSNLSLTCLWVSHLSDDDEEPDDQVRWLPGAELVAHAGVRLAPGLTTFADAGATALLGETELEVRHRVVAVWPWLSGLVRIGIEANW